MRKSAVRFLAVFLCAVMVLGILPPVTADALGTVTTRETVHDVEEISNGVFTSTDREVVRTRALREEPTERELPAYPGRERAITNGDGYITFETFADLQTLAAGTYMEYTTAFYIGSGPLVISQNLSLPNYLILYVEGQMQIPSGVRLYATAVVAEELIVNGSIHTALTDVSSTLTVNGTFYNYGDIYIGGTTVVTGAENIAHYYSDCAVRCWYYISDTASLQNAANAAADALRAVNSDANSPYAYWVYELVLDETDVSVTANMTIPANCELFIEGVTMTVIADRTLTLECYVWVEGGLTVNGTLNNNYVVDICYDEGGIMTIGAVGTYTGGGYLFVESAILSDPAAAVPGLGNYTSTFYNDEYGRYWELVVSDERMQLGTCTNPGWGYDYASQRSVPGYISWQNGIPDSGIYEIVVFRNYQIYDTYRWTFDAASTAQWHSVDSFINSDPQDGNYFFTVTAIGDGKTTTDSVAAVSENWYYTKPTAKLGTCTNLSMDIEYIYWDDPEDLTYADGYEIRLYYGATADAEPVYAGTSWMRDANGESFITDWTGFDNGEGYYYFTVRLLSSDINQVCNGDWAELSTPYYYAGSGEDDSNDTVQLPFSDYEWEVLKLVNAERASAGLKPLTGYALLQDAAHIRAEEVLTKFDHERPDGTSCVTVLDEIGLNYGAAGENIAYGQRTPEAVMNSWMNSDGHRGNILSENFAHIGVGFNSYGWVQMFTDGGRYTSIHVALPENASVAPGTTLDELDLVAVLNSSVYGECYLPVVSDYCSGYDPEQIGTQEVTISVLGVSATFEITVSGLKGDFDGNGKVDDADVAHLLWHTLFEDQYPLAISGDINGDGAVNDADVAYLLWHTLFPDQYPL